MQLNDKLQSTRRGPDAMIARIVTGIAVIAAATGAAAAQDLAAGAKSYKKCSACHDIGPNAKNKVGPVLNGLDGRKSGTIAGYNYSDANKNSGIVWDEAQFLDYIKMVFAGIKNEDEAKSLWAFIKQHGPDGNKK
jgi:cytochrome c